METKRCCKCKLELPLDNFNKSKTAKDGLQGYCKKCASIAIKEYYKNNKEKHIKICLKHNIKYIKALDNCYVKLTLTASNKNLNYKDIPKELVELQRENLKLKREIKEINKQINN